jgi:hypothetical protein
VRSLHASVPSGPAAAAAAATKAAMMLHRNDMLNSFAIELAVARRSACLWRRPEGGWKETVANHKALKDMRSGKMITLANVHRCDQAGVHYTSVEGKRKLNASPQCPFLRLSLHFKARPLRPTGVLSKCRTAERCWILCSIHAGSRLRLARISPAGSAANYFSVKPLGVKNR